MLTFFAGLGYGRSIFHKTVKGTLHVSSDGLSDLLNGPNVDPVGRKPTREHEIISADGLAKNGYGAGPEDMIAVIEDVHNGISFRGAAKKHKISETNLCDRHYSKGEVQVAGRPTSFYLTKKN